MPLAAAFIDESQLSTDRKHHGRRRHSGCQPAASAPIAARLARTGGSAVAVEESDIVRWQRVIAEQEGIFVEPTSAAALQVWRRS